MVYIYLFPLYTYTIFHILFIHSPISRHLACFHLLAIMNNTAVTLIAKDLVNICFHFFWDFYPEVENWGLPWWLTGKESACNAGNPSSVLGLGRSPGEGNGSPFWYSCLGNPMDYTVNEILQARILEWVAFPFLRRSSQPRDQTQVSCIASRFFTSWATREAQGKQILCQLNCEGNTKWLFGLINYHHSHPWNGSK